MKAEDGQEKGKKSINNNDIIFNHNTIENNIDQINNNIDYPPNNTNNKLKSKRKKSSDSNQDNIKKTFLKEFGIKEKKIIKTFDYDNLISKKSCTSFYFGDEHYYQKAFICTICDPKKNISCVNIVMIFVMKNVEKH